MNKWKNNKKGLQKFLDHSILIVITVVNFAATQLNKNILFAKH